MVALPRYVRPITKANGRRYYYFEKFRGTPQAWPRVPLPPDPLSEEFARRSAQCERLELQKTDEKCIFQFVGLTGLRHDLPSPNDAEAFWKAVDKAEDIGKKLAAGERKTFSALIAEFKASAAYQDDITQSTRDGYEHHLDTIDKIWGEEPVRNLTPEDAQKAIDTYRDTPAAGRMFRATLSRLIGWGIPRGYRNDNPVEKTEKYVSDGTYDPWPPWAFELFFENARVGLQLPVYSALFTGQRLVDVSNMRRPAPQATEMPLVAQKTQDLIPVQIHSEYRQIIDAARPVESNVVLLRDDTPQMLHLREDGDPWTLPGLKTAFRREWDRDVFKPFRDNRLVFHGLRKNAVCMLLEVGCTEAQVSAIVGMSPAMVAHYSKKVSRFRLARGAMRHFEEGWTEIRAAVLGQVKRIG
jgi:hypothetical protein